MSTATMLPPTDTGRCGTNAGYQRHRKRGEAPCRPCKDGKRAHARALESRPALAAYTARDRELARNAPPLTSGRLACSALPHQFRPMSRSQCGECWGFRDDPRHLVVVR